MYFSDFVLCPATQAILCVPSDPSDLVCARQVLPHLCFDQLWPTASRWCKE